MLFRGVSRFDSKMKCFFKHHAITNGYHGTALKQIRLERMAETLAESKPVPFSLLVSLTFTAPEHLVTFKRDFEPLAQYVRDYEPNTLSYEVLISDKDPLKVIILERYRDKAKDFVETHRNSGPFLEFRPKLKALQDAGFVRVDGESFYDSGIGFGDRIGLGQ